MVELSLLLPTRGRPDALGRLLQSIVETASRPERLEVVLYIDEDDESTRAFSFDGLALNRIVGPPGESMGRMLRSCYEASCGQAVMLLNDDVIFRTHGWDDAVVRALARFSDKIAFVYGNDLDQGRRVPSFPIVTRKACEVMEQLCPGGYFNLNIENHIFDVFRQLAELGHDRVAYLDRVIFEHMHHALGKSATDATSRKKDPAHDGRLFLALADERRAHAARLARHIARAMPGPPAEDQPVASIIVPVSAGAFQLTAQSLRGLFAQEGYGTSLEILLVADESLREEPFLKAREGGERMRALYASGNPGFAEAANLGAREVRSDLLVFLSNGCVPAPGWLDALLSTARQDDAIAAVGCRMLDGRTGRLHHAGLGFLNRPGRFAISQIGRGLPGDHPIGARARDLQAASAAGLLVKRPAFTQVGGFPTNAAGLEAVGLCLRLRERGSRIAYAPDATLHFHDNPAWRETFHRVRDAASLGNGWSAKIRDDLEETLRQDGLALPPGLQS